MPGIKCILIDENHPRFHMKTQKLLGLTIATWPLTSLVWRSSVFTTVCLLCWKKINCSSLPPSHYKCLLMRGTGSTGYFCIYNLFSCAVNLKLVSKNTLKQTTKHLFFFSPKQKQNLTFIAHNPANAPLPHTSQITSQNTRLSFYPHFHLQGQSANFAPIAEGPWGYSSTISIVTMKTMPAYSESRLNDFPSRKDFPAPRDRCGLS